MLQSMVLLGTVTTSLWLLSQLLSSYLLQGGRVLALLLPPTSPISCPQKTLPFWKGASCAGFAASWIIPLASW